MKVIENECVGCPPDLGCMGKSCKYIDVEKIYCDSCGSNDVAYRVGEEDFCFECFLDYLQDIFNELSIKDKANILNVDYEEIVE